MFSVHSVLTLERRGERGFHKKTLTAALRFDGNYSVQIFENVNRCSFTVYFQPSLSKTESLIMSHFVYLYIFY